MNQLDRRAQGVYPIAVIPFTDSGEPDSPIPTAAR